MVNALLSLFRPGSFVGPAKQPKRWDDPHHAPAKLFTRDFILLFLMAMCSNSFIAVYYSFEQWMEGLGIVPEWRGILLSSLFCMILVFRPVTSFLILRHGKFWSMIISLAICTLVMLGYPFVTPQNAIPFILGLRIIQGIALAVYLSCTVAVLVECIPPGQSARGFALFSLTMLLPYSIIPAVSESLLPVVGGEANLFAVMATLGIPSFIMVLLMARRLRKPELVPTSEKSGLTGRQLVHSLLHSGLGFVYFACLFFSITTNQAIFFMKGLATATGQHPATFFSFYSITIILVRVFGSHLMDTLPRHKISILSAGVLGLVMTGFAVAPGWAFIPLACVYGASLGLLYPLLAAVVYDRSLPDTRSFNSNIMMATFDASGMLAPMLGGTVIAWGFGYVGVFLEAAIIAGLCGFSMLIDGIIAIKSNRHRRKWK